MYLWRRGIGKMSDVEGFEMRAQNSSTRPRLRQRAAVWCSVGVRALFIASVCGLFACGSCGSTERNGTPVVTPQPDPPPSVDESPERARYVGINVASVSYWSQNYPFVDLVKGADGWISGHGETWDDGRDIATDEHGWIRSLESGQIARLFLIGGQPHHPTGRFVVTYEGAGDIEYVGEVTNLERGRGRDTFDLGGTDGLFLNITNVNAQNPIRNIAVYLPGGRCEGNDMQYCENDESCGIGRCVMLHETPGQYFHPDFLKEMQPFSLLRFMDWQDTNRLGSLPDDEEAPPIVEYSDIPVYESAFWRPVPTRVMLDLANRLDADVWFSIPHTASDQFIEDFAAILERRQSHRFKAYVEYSNEVWNDIFDQHQWVNARGCEAFGDPSQCDPNGDGTLCEYTEWSPIQERCQGYGRRYFSQRTAHIAEVLKRVVGEDRVVAVMGAQVGGGRDWWLEQLLNVEHDGKPAYESVDAVAVAPYFGGDVRDPEQVFATDDQGRYRMLVGAEDAEHGGVFDWVRNDLQAIGTLPEGSVRYLAYEGGQHLHAHEEATMDAFLDANRAPQMERVYDQYLRTWSSVTNNAPFVHYVSSYVWNQHGAWGSREYQGQPLSEAPKHRALLRYVASAP